MGDGTETESLMNGVDSASLALLCEPVIEAEENEECESTKDHDVHVEKGVQNSIAQLKCVYCSKNFLSQKEIQTHLKSIHKHIMCFCGHISTTSASYYKHSLSTHGDRRPFHCDDCEHRFEDLVSLNAHVKVTHQKTLSPKPSEYKCSMCPKVFQCKSYLIKHLQRHSKDSSFTCQICQAQLRERNCFISHVARHTGELPFKCKFCDEKFVSNNLKVNHERNVHIGSPDLVCSVCGLKLKTRATYRHHFRTHTGERPYACEICNKRFTASKTLVAHRRIHTGEKPFACDVCPKRFNQKSSLNTHKKMHRRRGEDRS